MTIVDDSYNASPGSVLAALDLLAGMPGRRIAVLGEMLELGDGHDEGHERVGAAAAALVDRLVVVGDGAAGIAAARATRAGERRASSRRRTGPAALAALEATLRDGDVVLVKASRGVELDLLVDDLVAALGGPSRGR